MFWSLFWHGTLPVVEVALLASLGLLLGKTGVLGSESRKAMTRLVYYLFVPAFIFSKLAPSVTVGKLVEWWPLIVNMAISISVGLGLGKVMAQVTFSSDPQRPILVAATALGNSGNMPLVLLVAIMHEGGWVLTQAQQDQGLSYVILGMMVASLTHTSLGTALLKRRDGLERLRSGFESELSMEEGRRSVITPTLPSFGFGRPREERSLLLLPNGSTPVNNPISTTYPPSKSIPLTTPYHTSTSFHRPSGLSEFETSVNGSVNSSVNLVNSKGMSPTSSSKNRVGKVGKVVGSWCRLAVPAVIDSISLPTLACVAALVVGLSPPIKEAMFKQGEVLSVIANVMNMFGSCAIPAMTLLMGASLSMGPGGGDVSLRHIISVIICRQVLLPVLGLALVMVSVKSSLIQCRDPLFVLVLLLQHTTPTAMNLHTLALLHQNGDLELSCLLFWQYVASLFTMPMFIMAYLHIIPDICPVL